MGLEQAIKNKNEKMENNRSVGEDAKLYRVIGLAKICHKGMETFIRSKKCSI